MSDSSALRILVVEDDADTRANLRDILEIDEYEVETAESFAQAAARQDWSRVFAVILDRRLPEGHAEDLLPRLKRLAPEAAILIVTGLPDLEGAVACLRQGAADYILKPISPEKLRASLGGIAERRRLAREKDRSEQTFRHLVEAADCMIVILRRDRAICYFSPYSQELTGYSSQEAVGRNFCDLCLFPEDREHASGLLDKIIDGGSIRGEERRVRCRDGSHRWLLWSVRWLEDYAGEPAFLAVGQDITARRRAEEQAKQNERLAAIGEMVTGLAHESRNALQRSKACLEMLAMEVEDRPEALDLVERAHKAQNHLHHLYEEVRSYAAPIVLRKHRCNLRDAWRDTWSHLADVRDGRQIELQEELDDVDLCVEADAFALGQVFRNVLENAVAACGEAGTVIIRCQATRLDEREAICVEVHDTGPGLNAEQQRRIFEPFYTTKTKGTGLGMAIAKRIIEAHAGQIAIDPCAAHGATIVLTIPRRAS